MLKKYILIIESNNYIHDYEDNQDNQGNRDINYADDFNDFHGIDHMNNNAENMDVDDVENVNNVNISYNLFKKLNDMLNNLKCKYNDPLSTRDERMPILTLLPESWTQEEIKNIFNTTLYMAKLSKKLQKKKGLMSIPNPIYRK